MPAKLEIDQARLAKYAKRWKIAQLEFFGSVLREDFGPASDVDALVSFLPEADWGLLDHARMQQELADLIGRDVDLVSRRAIESSENWIRRRAILGSAEVVYAQ